MYAKIHGSLIRTVHPSSGKTGAQHCTLVFTIRPTGQWTLLCLYLLCAQYARRHNRREKNLLFGAPDLNINLWAENIEWGSAPNVAQLLAKNGTVMLGVDLIASNKFLTKIFSSEP